MEKLENLFSMECLRLPKPGNSKPSISITLIFTKQVNKFYFRPNWQAVVAEASFEENDQEDFGAVVWKKGDDLDAFDVDSNNEESFDAGNYDFPFPNPDAVMLGYLGPAESW